MTRFNYAEYLSLFRSSSSGGESMPNTQHGVRRPCFLREIDGDLDDVTSQLVGDVGPIINAVREGDVKTVSTLAASISRNLSLGNSEGWTPLHEAAYCGQDSCVEALLKAKPALVDKRTLQEQTALLVAVSGGHMACVRCLLEGGADPDICNKAKETPLYKACEHGSLDLVRLILAFGGSVNQRCKRGRTALHEAAAQDNPELCEILLQAGAALDAPNVHGITPLILAAQQGRTHTVDLLIRKGADVNTQSCTGATALSEASERGRRDTVELLLRHNADTNRATAAGLLPLHVAAQHGHKEIVSLLLPVTSRAKLRHSGITPLHLAAEYDQRHVVTHLLESGAHVNAQLSKERSAMFHDHHATALYSAVAAGNREVAAILLRAGANPNVDPLSPLLVAARQGCLRTVAMLVEHGAQVNVSLPAHPSAFPGVLLCTQHTGILQYLFDHGCDAQACFRCHHSKETHLSVSATQSRERDPGFRSSPVGENTFTPHLNCSESTSEKKLQFCDWISSPSLSPWAGTLINLILDYVGNVRLCDRITEVLESHQDWIAIKEKSMSPRPLVHLCRLRIREEVGNPRLPSLSYLPLPQRLLQYLFNTCDFKDSSTPKEGSSLTLTHASQGQS